LSHFNVFENGLPPKKNVFYIVSSEHHFSGSRSETSMTRRLSPSNAVPRKQQLEKNQSLLIYKPSQPSGALAEFEKKFGGNEKRTQTPLFAELIAIVARRNGAPFTATPPRCDKSLETYYATAMKLRKTRRDARSSRSAAAAAARTAFGFFQAANPNTFSCEDDAKKAYEDLPRDKKGAYTALATKDTYRRVLESLEFMDMALDFGDDVDDVVDSGGGGTS
jgi:hypothetical protein